MKRVLAMLAAAVLCEGVGMAGRAFVSPGLPIWYQSLRKPSFVPENWVFGPVWITLYGLMGIAAWMVWDRHKKDERVHEALMIFAGQLGLNLLWNMIFFGTRNIELAFVEILILFGMVLFTMAKFARIMPMAALILVPYAAWVGWVAVLNLSIGLLNS